MKSKYSLLVLIALLAAFAMACQLGATDSTPSASSETPPTVLMEDDFSDTSSGWTTFSDQEGINEYLDGGFRILVNRENYYFWSNPNVNYTDVVIEVDGKKLAGPDENDYGLICRYQDATNFYFFTIGSDGYYGVSKYFNGEENLVGLTEMGQNTSVIQDGDATNHIKATCKGNSLTLEVNGTILVDVLDSDLTSGDIGLIAGTYDTIGVDVLFDNLVVTKP